MALYAVASRSGERARAFADKWGFEKAYDSYEAMLSDPAVDLVYVATPHSHHAEHTRLCIDHGKAALVEKAAALRAAVDAEPQETAERAMYEHEAVIPAMDAARELADALEMKVAKRCWPVPTYADLLYYV